MLEELKEMVDGLWRLSDQDWWGRMFGSDFVATINPKSKIPAMLDQSGDQAIRVFESANILLYLAEKFAGNWSRQILLKRTEVSTGSSGRQSRTFPRGRVLVILPLCTWENRVCHQSFAMEAKRQLDLLDKELATKPYIAGDDYTIADIAIWSWYGRQLKTRPGTVQEFS